MRVIFYDLVCGKNRLSSHTQPPPPPQRFWNKGKWKPHYAPPRAQLIERYRCWAKRFARENCGYNFEALKAMVPEALASVRNASIRGFYTPMIVLCICANINKTRPPPPPPPPPPPLPPPPLPSMHHCNGEDVWWWQRFSSADGLCSSSAYMKVVRKVSQYTGRRFKYCREWR